MNNQQKVILGLVLAIVVGGGIWYAVAKNGASSNTNQVVVNNSNTNTNTTLQNTNDNTNSSTVNGNTNVNTSQTQLYQGNGFSVHYPKNLVLIPNGNNPYFGFNKTGYTIEDSTVFPISIVLQNKNADDYTSTLPSANKTRVTVNNYSGYKTTSVQPGSTAYVFSLAGNKKSVVIGNIIEELQGTGNVDASAAQELNTAYKQIVDSIQID